ncbi:MAG: hypothetical protein AAFX04_02040 [Pseudomonadota bacterium]
MSEPVNSSGANSVTPQVPGEGRFTGENVSHAETAQIQQRQRARSRIMALGLVALCVLFFLITIVKIGVWG